MRYLFHAFAALEVLLKGSLLWNSGHALGLTGSPALGMKLFRVSHLIAGASDATAAKFPPFQPTRCAGTASSTQTPAFGSVVGGRGDALAEMPSDKPRAQLAFKNSMIRGILQFTLRIAFRCVLHRCKSQDIRC
jgi:hypothetical protein